MRGEGDDALRMCNRVVLASPEKDFSMYPSTIAIREAIEADVPAIVAMLASDTIGGHGDSTDAAALPSYLAAFRTIAASTNETLYVATIADAAGGQGEVVATFQTLVTTTLLGRGSAAMIIEAVHTRADCRGQGIGAQMIRFCTAKAEADGLRLVQLTSNAGRKDAHRFYEKLGFKQSHLGFKMRLN